MLNTKVGETPLSPSPTASEARGNKRKSMVAPSAIKPEPDALEPLPPKRARVTTVTCRVVPPAPSHVTRANCAPLTPFEMNLRAAAHDAVGYATLRQWWKATMCSFEVKCASIITPPSSYVQELCEETRRKCYQTSYPSVSAQLTEASGHFKRSVEYRELYQMALYTILQDRRA